MLFVVSFLGLFCVLQCSLRLLILLNPVKHDERRNFRRFQHPLFNYIARRIDVKRAFPSTILLRTFLAPINILQVTFEVLHVVMLKVLIVIAFFNDDLITKFI